MCWVLRTDSIVAAQATACPAKHISSKPYCNFHHAERRCPTLCRDLASNNISGVLPDAWANPQALPQLSLLSLAGNSLEGELPLLWAEADAFGKLTELDLSRNNFNSSLPDDWGLPGAFPNLTAL